MTIFDLLASEVSYVCYLLIVSKFFGSLVEI